MLYTRKSTIIENKLLNAIKYNFPQLKCSEQMHFKAWVDTMYFLGGVSIFTT